MTYPIFVERLNGKSGKPYTRLSVDLGYRVAILSFDSTTIMELLNVNPRDYSEIPIGYKVEVGAIKNLNKE